MTLTTRTNATAGGSTCDGNKTPLTERVTATVAQWMNERGMKPVETEVPVAAGWIADLAGVICPTRTEASDLKLIPRSPRCYANPNYAAMNDEREAAFQALPPLITVLVEVKTSRGDFRGDRKWELPRPAHLCYLATPPDIVGPNEVPMGWGWIVVGEEAKQKLPPQMTPQTDAITADLIWQVAVRRDHQTRYARLREIQKKRRAEEAEGKAYRRMSALIAAACDAIAGRKPLEESLRWCGVKLRKWELEEMQRQIAEVTPCQT